MSVVHQEKKSRRAQSIDNRSINGIDYVTTEQDKEDDGRFWAEVHFFEKLKPSKPNNPDEPPHPDEISSKNIVIFDSRRNRIVAVKDFGWRYDTDEKIPQSDNVIRFRLDETTLGRTYRLKLIELDDDLQTDQPLDGFDPAFVEADLIFHEKGKQTTHVDPESLPTKPFPQRPEPEINYLAKDYQSFRQLILDRLAKVMPDWQEHHAADVGMTLVELLAYTGDQLSYAQDAVATEMYLETARQRISVRRHARLVDYQIHEGANSIGLVHLSTVSDVSLDPKQVFFITSPPSDWQIDSFVFSALELEELNVNWANYVEAFEPIVESTSEWRFKSDEIIDVAGFISKLEKTNEQDGSKKNPFNGLREFTNGLSQRKHLSEHSREQIASLVNEILEDSDLTKFIEPQEVDEKCSDRDSLGIESLKRDFPNASQAMINRFVFYKVFSPLVSPPKFSRRLKLLADHNEIHFYTWGESECWLPVGSTAATLVGIDSKSQPCETAATLNIETRFKKIEGLHEGQILVFEETKGPKTGRFEDANPLHRQAVRITKVTKVTDEVPLSTPTVFEIEWAQEDALKFPLCISSTTSPSSSRPNTGCRAIKEVSVARGNMVLVDHGRTIPTEEIVEGPVGHWEQISCASDWDEPYWIQKREHYLPILREPHLTAVRSRTNFSSVSRLLFDQPHKASPSIRLIGFPAVPGTEKGIPLTERMLEDFDLLMRQLNNWHEKTPAIAYAFEDLLTPETAKLLQEVRDLKVKATENDQPKVEELTKELKRTLLGELNEYVRWGPKDDLIGSSSNDHHFVAEIDNQRRTQIRFGDGDNGRMPDVGMKFFATYRVGSGTDGNVGPNSITHMVTRNGLGREIVRVSNPLPTSGGITPETLKEVKVKAPNQYRSRQNRAILASDYQQIVMRNFSDRVQACRAQIEHRGLHWDVTVVIDPLAHERDLITLCKTIQDDLFKFKRIGHEVTVQRAHPVPVELIVYAQLHQTALRAEVFRDLSNVFSSRDLGYGKRGFFHPDNLTLGQSIHVSELISEALKIAGIKSIVIERLSRLDRNENVARGIPRRQTSEASLEPMRRISGTDTDAVDDPPNTLTIGALEIAKLDNQGGQRGQQQGKLTIRMGGGK